MEQSGQGTSNPTSGFEYRYSRHMRPDGAHTQRDRVSESGGYVFFPLDDSRRRRISKLIIRQTRNKPGVTRTRTRTMIYNRVARKWKVEKASLAFCFKFTIVTLGLIKLPVFRMRGEKKKKVAPPQVGASSSLLSGGSSGRRSYLLC